MEKPEMRYFELVDVAEATKWAEEDTVALSAGELTESDAKAATGTTSMLASRNVLLNSQPRSY
jgi:hypothetical protein